MQKKYALCHFLTLVIISLQQSRILLLYLKFKFCNGANLLYVKKVLTLQIVSFREWNQFDFFVFIA